MKDTIVPKVSKKPLQLLKYIYFYIGDYLFTVKFNKHHSTELLIVRLDAIGDFIIWLDSAKEYRRLYPQRKITLYANALWYNLAKTLPYWDKVIPIDLPRFSSKPSYRWKLLRNISQAGYSIAIHPTFSRSYYYGDSVIRASRAYERIGSQGDLSNIKVIEKAISDRWYSNLLPATKTPLMELERNAEFIHYLSGQKFTARVSKLLKLSQLPDNLNIDGEYIVIFPGASWHGRQWPPAYFAELSEHIHKLYGFHIIICGSSAEAIICKHVADKSSVASVNLAGKTTLSELTELIRGARLLIANETSAIHIAAAVGTPSVCILGGGHYGRFMPYPEKVEGIKPLTAVIKMDCFNCNWQCNQQYDPSGATPCVLGISVNQVIELAEQALLHCAPSMGAILEVQVLP